ncbi:hypothetical protein Tco_0303999 [Tanacetum coccineum]
MDFRRWQKKMHLLLSSMSVVYVLTNPSPEDGGNDATMEQIRKRAKNMRFFGAKYMADDASSKKFLVSNFTNYKMTDSRLVMEQYNELLGPSIVNMVEHNNSTKYNDNKGKRKHHDNTRAYPNKKAKPTCWKFGKIGHIKRDCKSVNVYYVTYVSEAYFVQDDDVAWWVDLGATVYVCKDRCWFKTYESLNDGSILQMRNESTTLVQGGGCVDLRLNIVTDNIASAFMSTFKLNDSILWHARLAMSTLKGCKICQRMGLSQLLTWILKSDEALDKFKVFKTEVELQQGTLIKRFKTDRGGEYMDTLYFQSVGLSQGFWSEAICKAVVRLPDPKLKTLGEKGIKCIFVGYVEHSKAFRFNVIKPNDSVSIKSIIESRDVIFDENRFSSVPKLSQRSLVKETEESGGSVVPEEVTKEVVQQPEPELRKRKRNRTPKDFGHEFQLYLIEGTRDKVSDQHSYCFNVEDDPKTFNEAMKS